MDPNEPQQHYFTSTTATASAAPTNGLLQNNDGSHMVYPHSVPSAVTSPLEPAKRKRGRPRKYVTPEQALAAKKAASSSSKERRELQQQQQQALGIGGDAFSLSGSSKKAHLAALGNVGQGFTPHVINVSAGEDVGQKIMMFMQQSKRELCILSASGSISNASLRQAATSGGGIAYEGRYEIISLSGSYVRTESGGRTGGLSICLCNSDGQVIGGGVGGPLKAAGPVQIVVGTFLIDAKKEMSGVAKVEALTSRLPSSSPIGGMSSSNIAFRPTFDSSLRSPVLGNDDRQSIGGNHFMIQQQGLHMSASRPTEWRTAADGRNNNIGYDMTGRPDHRSPENGAFEQMAD